MLAAWLHMYIVSLFGIFEVCKSSPLSQLLFRKNSCHHSFMVIFFFFTIAEALKLVRQNVSTQHAVKRGIRNSGITGITLIDRKLNCFGIADIARVELPSGEVALPMLALLSVFWSCRGATNAKNFVEDLDCCPKARPAAKIRAVLSS